MFTVEARDRVRERLLELAEADPGVVAAAVTGSLAVGAGDRWSDVDLALAIDGELPAVLERWTGLLVRDFGALHHWDLPWGSTVFRVFLLPGCLEVDLAFTPAAEFGPRGPSWRTVFGDTVELAPWPAGSRRSPSACSNGASRTTASPTSTARPCHGPLPPWRRWWSPTWHWTTWTRRPRPRRASPGWQAPAATARSRRWRRWPRPTWPRSADATTRPGAGWNGRSPCSRTSTSRTRRRWRGCSSPASWRPATRRWPSPRRGPPSPPSSSWGRAATRTRPAPCSAPSGRRAGPVRREWAS
jgi:hypothetical protein